MKLICLDLDGTLEDSRDDMADAAVRVRAQLGLAERPETALRPHVNGGMDALYRACFDDYLAMGDEATRMKVVREAYEAHYIANVAVFTRLYPGVADMLEALAKLGKLACVTNKPEKISRRLLDELGVGALFSAVIGGDTCAQAKPHPMMLQAAADSCGFDSTTGQSYMAGDTAADIKLGRAFGADTIWCAWGYVSSIDPQEAEPAHVAKTPSELIGIIGAVER